MPPRRVSFSSAVAIALLHSAAGCTPEAHRYIQFPTLFNPGPAQFQRVEAVRHDPYPLNDVGPAIDGGRPREYLQPVNEVERARMAAPVPSGVQPGPMTSYPVGPPVVSGPPVITGSPDVTGPPVITGPPQVVPPPAVLPPVVTAPFPVAPAMPTGPQQMHPRSPY
jgi:hypothetical protein